MDDELLEYCDGDIVENERFVRYKEDESDEDDDDEYDDEDEYDEETEYDKEEEYSSDDDYDSEQNDEHDSAESENNSEASSNSGTAVAGGSAAVVAIVAAVVIVTSIVSGFKIIINDLTAYARSLAYDLTVETEYKFDAEAPVDWNHFDTGLQLIISSDKEEDIKTLLDTGMDGTEVEVKAKSDTEDNDLYDVTMRFKGKVDGLTPRHPYTVSIRSVDEDNGKTYYKGSFTTTGPVTQINAISGYCTCNKDGKYHFKLEYEDDGNNFSDFEYRLLDNDGTELIRSGFDEPDKEQEIPGVDQIKGSEKQLVISFRSSYEPDLNAEHKITELSSGTKMEIHKGMVTITQNISI
ncbi:MAG: hypothetical protein IK093_07975 [Ruminiclostridium sp.]|nr:hypothetical protein [Ruminiclostridium sp.]